MPPRSGATAGSAAFVRVLPVVNKPRRIDLLEGLFPRQKPLSKNRGLMRRWQDAHLVAFGPDPVLLQVYAALVRRPAACIVPQLAAVLLDDDHPCCRLEDDAGVAPLNEPLEFGL